MSKNVEIQFEIDTDKATGSMKGLNSEYRRLLADLGKTPTEIKAIMKLAADAQRGKVEIADLDHETRQLIETHQALAKVAQARESLNLIPHAKVSAEIEDLRRHYDNLKKSGVLTTTELRQASVALERDVAKLEKQASGLGDAFSEAKGELLQAAAAGAGLVVAARQAIEFEDAMGGVSKSTGLAGEDLADLAQQIKDMSSEIPIGIDQLAGIAAQAGQLGVATDDIEEFVSLAARMGTAFDMSAEQAGDSVAKLKNVFQLSIKDVEALGDAINVLGNNTAALEKDIVEVLTRVGGTAKQFGLAADGAAALAAAFLSLGKPPEVAATAINALLSKMQTANVGTKEFKSALGDLGISADQLARDISADPQAALIGFLQTLEKLDKQSRAEIITRLFGAEYQDDVSLLVGSISEYEKTLGLATDRQKVAGAMMAEFGSKLGLTSTQITLLTNTVERAATGLGEAFLPVVKAVASGALTAAEAVATFTEKFPAASAAAATLATIAVSIGSLKLAFAALGLVSSKSLDAISGKLTALNTDIKSADTAAGNLKATMGLLSNALAAGVVGWEFGTFLRDEFKSVELFGIEMAWSIGQSFEKMRYYWEAYNASFNDDTWEAALQRHQARLGELNGHYRILYEDAKTGGGALKEPLDAAAQAAADAEAEVRRMAAAARDAPATAAPALSAVEQQLASLAAQGKTTGEALADVFSGLDLGSAPGIAAAAEAISRVGNSASSTKTEVDALAGSLSSLSGAQLQQLGAEMSKRFEQGTVSAERFGQAMDAIAEQSLQKMGLSLGELSTGISAAEQDLLGAFSAFLNSGRSSAEGVATAVARLQDQIKSPQAFAAAQSLVGQWEQTHKDAAGRVGQAMDNLGKTIDGSSANIVSGLQEKLAGVKDAAGLNSIRQEFLAMGAAGKVAGEDVAAGLELISQKRLDLGKVEQQQGDQQKKNNIAIIEQQKEVTAEMGNTAAAAGGIGMAITALVDSARNDLAALSDAAAAAFDAGFIGKPALDELDQATQKLDQVDNKIRAVYERMMTSVDASGIGDWVTGMQSAAYEIEQSFYRQQQSFLELKNDIENGSVGLGRLSSLATSAKEKFDLLDEQDLSQLQSAIDAARQKIESLNDSAAATLSSLQNELDQLNGNLVDVEKRNYEQKKAELEKQLEEARKNNARDAQSDLEASLAALKKLHDAKMDNIRKEAEAERTERQKNEQTETADATNTRNQQPPTPQPQRQQTTTTTTTTVIRLESAAGQSVELQSSDPNAANKVIDILQSAGMRTGIR